MSNVKFNEDDGKINASHISNHINNEGINVLNKKENVENYNVINGKEILNENIQQETTYSKKSSKTNISIEGLEVKIADKVIQHEDFILHLYNSQNEELKKEVLKRFDIRKAKNSKKTNFDDYIENNYDSNKVLDSLGRLDTKNIVTEISNKTIDFNKKANINLIDNEANNYEVKTEKMNKEKTRELKVKIKYIYLLRICKLIIFFFKTEYRLINIFIKQFNVLTKTTIWTLICFRLFASLFIGAILSSRTVEDHKTSTVKLFIYNFF